MNGTRRTRPLRGPASYRGGLFQALWGGAENWVQTSQTGVYFSATPCPFWTTLRWIKAKKQLSYIFSFTINDSDDRLFHLFQSRIWIPRTKLFSESLGGLRVFTALAPVQFLVGGTEILKTMSHGPKKTETKKLHKVVSGFWTRIQKILLISCPWSFLLHLGCPWYWPHS